MFYANQLQNPTVILSNMQNEVSFEIQEYITDYTLVTQFNIKVPITFYNRNSDTVIIVAGPLPAAKEEMAVFAKIFKNCDVILFDYRWAHQYESFLIRSVLLLNPVKKILLDETVELEEVIDFVKRKKLYKNIVGLGECYGCFHLAKIQADAVAEQGKGPFTHFIFDSCWHSLHDFAQRICSDPLLPISPQVGGAPHFIKMITNSRAFKFLALGFVFSVISDISIDSYISQLDIPVLFVHGQNDRFVPFDDFVKIWNATNPICRSLFYTPYCHCDNLGNKVVYQRVCEQFISVHRKRPSCLKQGIKR